MFRFRIVSRMCQFGEEGSPSEVVINSETRVPNSKGLVKQYNQELCISSNNFEHFEVQPYYSASR